MILRGQHSACRLASSLLGRALTTLEPAAAASAGALPHSFVPWLSSAGPACEQPVAGFPWAAANAAFQQQLQQQPACLSQGIAPLPAALPAAAGQMWAPQHGGVLQQVTEWHAASVKRKRKLKMNKHKMRRRLRKNRLKNK